LLLLELPSHLLEKKREERILSLSDYVEVWVTCEGINTTIISSGMITTRAWSYSVRCLSLLYTRRQLGGQTFLTKLADSTNLLGDDDRPTATQPCHPFFVFPTHFSPSNRSGISLSRYADTGKFSCIEVPRFFAGARAHGNSFIGSSQIFDLALCCCVCLRF
jgi:hypothetical protein